MDDKKILIVDDEPFILEIISMALDSKHYKIVTANDGDVALKICENQDFDLIITDLDMPKISGDKLIREVQKNRPDQKCMIVSAKINGFEERLEGVDVTYKVSKPFAIEELQQHVMKALKL